MSPRTLLSLAALTGLFCTVFAIFMSWATMYFGLGQIVGISFVSGFLGSLFSNFIVKPWRARRSEAS